MPSPLLRGALYVVCSEALVAVMTVAIRVVSAELASEWGLLSRAVKGCRQCRPSCGALDRALALCRT